MNLIQTPFPEVTAVHDLHALFRAQAAVHYEIFS